MDQYTPMLRQYFELREQYPGCLLLFRLGDFYEIFGEDAKLASRLLQITLTSRDAGRGKRLPMCGVPHHSVDKYIAELVQKGYKVALCEQLEDPKTAKGIVRRDVTRVITPGTVTDAGMLNERENNFLVALCRRVQPAQSASDRLPTHFAYAYGLAVCDLSTGEFMCTQIEGDDAQATLRDELTRLAPAELLLDPSFDDEDARAERSLVDGIARTPGEVLPARSFYYESTRKTLLEHFGVESLEGFGCEGLHLAIRAAGACIDYLRQTQRSSLDQIARLSTYWVREHMALDAATRRNLELTRTLREGERKGTLLWVLDKTRTSCGGRLLRRWIEQPLLSAEAVRARLACVREFVDDPELRLGVQALLERVYDVERLVGRIAFGTANARDLIALKNSLEILPELRSLLEARASAARLDELCNRLDPCTDVAAAIGQAIVDEPPVSITEGGLIRDGYSEEVDQLRRAATEGKDWIKSLEQQERERTQIKSLKVGYNKVFGYYIEVTRPNLALVPDDYQRKQTLAHAERFITPELKEKESQVLGAHERVVELEYQLFTELRSRLAKETVRLQETAKILAEIDVYASLAEVAVERRYTMPEVDDADRIEIEDGRHPVVEAMPGAGAFVPNDLTLDARTRVIVLTGPNMAGKSTYLRQSALIVLMAQIGSFVPARAARIGVVDRIFTRVGASDDLATGQSTFMVEMNEVANILNHATPKSLVILDEVGRGTSTFDGLSIAWAVTEYLAREERVRAKTLFATHYHELTELEELLPGVRNFSVAVHKEGRDVVFLRRIVPGGAERSYGIEVARLAGLPTKVIERAREVLAALEAGEEHRAALQATAAAREHAAANGEALFPPVRSRPVQIPLFVEPDPLIERLSSIDVNEITPLQALNQLAELVQEARKRVKER